MYNTGRMGAEDLRRRPQTKDTGAVLPQDGSRMLDISQPDFRLTPDLLTPGTVFAGIQDYAWLNRFFPQLAAAYAAGLQTGGAAQRGVIIRYPDKNLPTLEAIVREDVEFRNKHIGRVHNFRFAVEDPHDSPIYQRQVRRNQEPELLYMKLLATLSSSKKPDFFELERQLTLHPTFGGEYAALLLDTRLLNEGEMKRAIQELKKSSFAMSGYTGTRGRLVTPSRRGSAI